MPVEVRTCATMAEAAGIVSSQQGARFFGGGTLVMREVNEGRLINGVVVRVTDPAFRQMTTSGPKVEIGAGVTMAMILANPDVSYLHAAAKAIGGPALRSMATVGGNLFAETPYGDITVMLLALDAQITVQTGYGGGRAMPLEELLAARGRSGQGLVTSIQFARPQNVSDVHFLKISRVKPKGISVMCLAAHLPMMGGRIGNARVTYGAMAPMPIRARGVERALEGKTLDVATIAAAQTAAAEGIQPATDAIASEWYRREVLPVHVGRMLSGKKA